MTPKLAIRVAEPEDVPAMQAIAEAAYAPYVERMGRRPAPMDADFAAHIERREAYVSHNTSGITGFIVTYAKKANAKEEGQFIENVAVADEHRGTGLGRQLCQFAVLEAKRRKLPRVFLYTNEKMTENLKFYADLGYDETHRVTEDGFDRVYMEKRLTP